MEACRLEYPKYLEETPLINAYSSERGIKIWEEIDAVSMMQTI